MNYPIPTAGPFTLGPCPLSPTGSGVHDMTRKGQCRRCGAVVFVVQPTSATPFPARVISCTVCWKTVEPDGLEDHDNEEAEAQASLDRDPTPAEEWARQTPGLVVPPMWDRDTEGDYRREYRQGWRPIRDLDMSDVTADADRMVGQMITDYADEPVRIREDARFLPLVDAILVVTMLDMANQAQATRTTDDPGTSLVELYDLAIGLGRDEIAEAIGTSDVEIPTWEGLVADLRHLAAEVLVHTPIAVRTCPA
jgi:hypothetical protein